MAYDFENDLLIGLPEYIYKQKLLHSVWNVKTKNITVLHTGGLIIIKNKEIMQI